MDLLGFNDFIEDVDEAVKADLSFAD